ncbi:MAG: hypothetical protein IIA72_03380 [Proteobacteria bacterium]|nr:hypothetical protein [Pseudomonadota bacterium]
MHQLADEDGQFALRLRFSGMTGSGVGYLIFRKFSSTPAAGCAEPEDAPTTTASIRSLVLGPDLQLLAGLARRPGDRQASNSDRLDRSQVEIKASRDTTTGFITLDRACKKNPKRPQIEASRRKVQEMQRIRVFGNDNRPFLLCLPSCCRPVSGLLPACYRRVSDVFFTCSR